jgi:DNA-binding FadR family transcriptional regulator
LSRFNLFAAALDFFYFSPYIRFKRQLVSCMLSDNRRIVITPNQRVKPFYMESWKTPSPHAVRPRRPRGLVQVIVEDLANSIKSGQIKPGDKLPTESEIMTRFEVSRTVVREALSKLQASGLVETRHGIGTFALALPDTCNFRIAPEDFSTVADVISLLELRISLETEAAGLAAQRRTDANLSTLGAALASFSNSVSHDADTLPADFEFHMEVARATGNQHFADLMNYLGTMIIPRARVNTPSSAPEGRLVYLQRLHGEHESIFNAIRNRDADAARAAMRTHLSNSRERLRKSQLSQV